MLFLQLPRGVELTQQGEALLRHASLQLQDARKEVRALAGGAVGELRIGAGPSWLGRALPRIIAELTAVAARRCRPYLKGLVSSRPGDDTHQTCGATGQAPILVRQNPDPLPLRSFKHAFRTFDCVFFSDNGCCPGQLWSNFHCRASKASLMIIDFHTHVLAPEDQGQSPAPSFTPASVRTAIVRFRTPSRTCLRPPRSAASISL